MTELFVAVLEYCHDQMPMFASASSSRRSLGRTLRLGGCRAHRLFLSPSRAACQNGRIVVLMSQGVEQLRCSLGQMVHVGGRCSGRRLRVVESVEEVGERLRGPLRPRRAASPHGAGDGRERLAGRFSVDEGSWGSCSGMTRLLR